MTCKYCGQALSAGARRCTACGRLTDNAFRSDYTTEFARSDIERRSSISVLAYCGPLLLIPALVARRSPYARFHVNQGLALLVVEMAYNLAARILTRILDLSMGSGLSEIPTTLSTVLSFASLFFLVLTLLGAINALRGRAKELPLVGRIRFLR